MVSICRTRELEILIATSGTTYERERAILSLRKRATARRFEIQRSARARAARAGRISDKMRHDARAASALVSSPAPATPHSVSLAPSLALSHFGKMACYLPERAGCSAQNLMGSLKVGAHVFEIFFARIERNDPRGEYLYGIYGFILLRPGEVRAFLR